MMPPCLGCQDREIGCHGKCKQYQAFNKEREKIRSKRAEQGEMLQALFGPKKPKYKKNSKKMR